MITDFLPGTGKKNLNGCLRPPVSLNRKKHQPPDTMKTHTKSRNYVSLGELVATVSSYARNEGETLAALQDLFRKGSVVARTRRGSKRLKLA